MTRPIVRAAALRWAAAAALAALPPQRAAAQGALFAADSVLSLTIRADLRSLFRDRDTSRAVWHEGSISYAGGGGPVTVPVRLRTRGVFRRATCDVPPIRLRFSDSARGTVFERARRPKLVNPCRDRPDYEQLALQEYAIYRVLRLFTPVSLSARLLRVTWEDTRGAVRPVTRVGFLTEDPDRLAERLDGAFLVEHGTRLGRLSPGHAALLGVFEYFIANTDWSMPGLHNIALLKVRDSTYALPYDFDWSGVVDAPYARPAPILPIRSVRERIYRGYCQSAAELEPVLSRFEALRDTIAALYRAIPGLEPRTIERTARYYDEFYRAIADRPRFAHDVVQRDCLP